MKPSGKRRIQIILASCLVLMVGVSIWINKAGLGGAKATTAAGNHGEGPGVLYKPPIDGEDEARNLLQKASENYFYHEFSEGADNYRKAIAIYEARNNFRGVAKTYESLGDLYKFANEIEEAESSYLEAVKFHVQNRDSIGEGRAFKDIGDMYVGLNRMEPAEGWYKKAGNALKGAPVHRDQAMVHEAIGQFYWKTENVSEALVHFTQAQETFAQLKDQMGYDHITNIIAVIKKKRSPSSHFQRGTGIPG